VGRRRNSENIVDAVPSGALDEIVVVFKGVKGILTVVLMVSRSGLLGFARF